MHEFVSELQSCIGSEWLLPPPFSPSALLLQCAILQNPRSLRKVYRRNIYTSHPGTKMTFCAYHLREKKKARLVVQKERQKWNGVWWGSLRTLMWINYWCICDYKVILYYIHALTVMWIKTDMVLVQGLTRKQEFFLLISNNACCM